MISNEQVVERFSRGKNGNGRHMYSEGDSVYSYGSHFQIAKRLISGFFLFTRDSYSNTTGRHKNSVLYAIPRYKTIFVDGCRDLNKEIVFEQMQKDLSEIRELKSFKRKSKVRSSKIEELEENVVKILEFFKTDEGKEIMKEKVLDSI